MLDESDGIEDARQILAGNAELLRVAETHAHEDGVVLRQELIDRFDRDTGLELDTEVENVLDLCQRHIDFQLVFRDPVGVESTRLRTALEHRNGVSHDAKISGAREARGPGADNRNALARWLSRLEELDLLLEHVVGGVPLQQRNLDRLLI